MCSSSSSLSVYFSSAMYACSELSQAQARPCMTLVSMIVWLILMILTHFLSILLKIKRVLLAAVFQHQLRTTIKYNIAKQTLAWYSCFCSFFPVRFIVPTASHSSCWSLRFGNDTSPLVSFPARGLGAGDETIKWVTRHFRGHGVDKKQNYSRVRCNAIFIRILLILKPDLSTPWIDR